MPLRHAHACNPVLLQTPLLPCAHPPQQTRQMINIVQFVHNAQQHLRASPHNTYTALNPTGLESTTVAASIVGGTSRLACHMATCVHASLSSAAAHDVQNAQHGSLFRRGGWGNAPCRNSEARPTNAMHVARQHLRSALHARLQQHMQNGVHGLAWPLKSMLVPD